jgi:hypothetical protein
MLGVQELEFTTRQLAEMAPSPRFAPPQPVAVDAPAIDKLAARLGRQVNT